ncbi:MAG TPA: hypothetical protein PK228_14145, partial [Saprospiraceae bacterium]|nr:hypothetical protein [Saprospiraceae bacterium]
DQSILAAVRESKPSAAGVSPAFKKINRPGGKIARKVTANLTQYNETLTPDGHYPALFDNLNNAGQFNIIGAAPKKTPFNFNNTTSLNLTQLNPDDEVIANKMSPYTLPVNAGSGPAVIENVNAQIIAAIQPLKAIGERILRIVPLPSVAAFPTSSVSVIKPVMAAPDLPYPMYEYLSALSPEFILPGLSEFPNNTVALLEPNKKFIEAYMAGLNHEMARELLWREYPTDQRGSYFRQFWNTLDFIPPSGTNAVDLNDIELMHTWNGKLGSHLPPNGHAPGLVLVFRGDLFRKFPNMIIFAQQAIVDPVTQKKILDTSGQAGTIKFPILKGKIPADITIVGFDLTPEQATAGAGWFFVFQERLGETRFGLDANQNPPDQMDTWDDLDWAYIDNNTSLDVYPPDKLLATSPTPTPPNNIIWGKDAAHVAYTLYQSPVLLGFHASDFMPPKPLVTTTDHNTNYIALS